jgi:hypothetical protein
MLKWVFWRTVLTVLYVMLISLLVSYYHMHKNYHKKIWFQRILCFVFFVSHIFLLVWFVMCD